MKKAFIIFFACLACTPKPTSKLPPLDPVIVEQMSPWEKESWIAKVANSLRYQSGLKPDDNMEELKTKSALEVIEYFMKDPEFLDRVLDFNFFFVGSRRDSIKNYETFTYDYDAWQNSYLIDSAKAIESGGDFLSLIDFRSPFYLPMFTPPKAMPPLDPNSTPEQIRKYYYDRAIKLSENILKLAETNLEANKGEICPLFLLGNNQGIYRALRYWGVPNAVGTHLFSAEGMTYNITKYCFGGATNTSTIVEDFRRLKDALPQFFKYMDELRLKTKQPAFLTDVQLLDEKRAFLTPRDITGSGNALFAYVENSSTNYNRKRAAYILKNYFCDDLTPIGIVAPLEHINPNKHLSDVSCASCHYKLDPMAGFFKKFGRYGINYSDEDEIVFSDNARMSRKVYESSWKAPEGAAHEWNIGFIRSAEYLEYNEYGSEPEDVMKIIRNAPEVKACIVKRMLEYFISPQQSFDPAYREALVKEFIDNTKINSSMAFKTTLKRILLSHTFTQRDPKSDECYDYLEKTQAENHPPCRVSYLFQKNCVQCHSSSNSSGRLDLSRWILVNSKPTFPHLDKNGKQRERKETLTSINERISNSDQELRMPYKRYISNSDREEIYRWIEEEFVRERQGD